MRPLPKQGELQSTTTRQTTKKLGGQHFCFLCSQHATAQIQAMEESGWLSNTCGHRMPLKGAFLCPWSPGSGRDSPGGSKGKAGAPRGRD